MLDIYLKHGMSPTQIGWVGFGGNCAGAVGGVLAGVLIDRFDHSLKRGMVALYAGATVSAVAFLLFVYMESSHLELLPIFLSVVCQGFFANAAAPVALEMAAETTYPVGEETSATLLVVFFAAIMVAFIQFSDVISPVAMNWVNTATLAATTVGLMLVPAANVRKAVDSSEASHEALLNRSTVASRK